MVNYSPKIASCQWPHKFFLSLCKLLSFQEVHDSLRLLGLPFVQKLLLRNKFNGSWILWRKGGSLDDCMYQLWTYWLHKECIKLNIFSPLTLGVITLNASLNFHGWVTEAMRGKNKTHICHISFIITQLEDGLWPLKKNKNKLLKKLLPACLPFSVPCSNGAALNLIFVFSSHTWHSGLWKPVIAQQAFTRVESSLRVEEFSDQHNILCILAYLCTLGPEGKSNWLCPVWDLLPCMF